MSEPSLLADATGRAGLLDPDPLRLSPPAEGDRMLRHDPEFVALDAGLSGIRDVVNAGIDALNSVGAGLPKLPEGSLEELLIQPLTGDYQAIRQNAEATHQVRDALATYSGNVVRLSVAVDPRWGGKAATAYLLRLGVHAAAARGAGELVARTSVVFDHIADFSERLTVEVETLVVELVETGARLVRQLLTRLLGPTGWAAFLAEFAVKGFDAVTDIIDDIRRLLEIIERLRTLRGDVEAWVAEQRARLEALLDLVDHFLPGGAGGSA
jgi:hypothetical protein